MQHTDVTIKIPQDRVTDFYIMFADWLSGKRQEAPRRRGPRRAARLGNSRYAGITTMLGELAEDTGRRQGQYMPVAFEEIEKAIDGELPSSADRHRAWWANTDRNTQARTWMEVGWFVDQVDFANRSVLFRRAS